MNPDDVTLVDGAIHNPDDPRHFMTITPLGRPVTATLHGETVAASTDALVVREVAYRIYDPVVYFPRNDVDMDRLQPTSTTTYCPLKGDTEYFDVTSEQGTANDGAWSYIKMRLGDELRDLIAFDTTSVVIA